MARSIDPVSAFRELAGRPPASDEIQEIARAVARWRALTGAEIDGETVAFAVLVAAMSRGRAEGAGEAAARRLESAGEGLAAKGESIVALIDKKVGEVSKAGIREIADEVVRSRRRARAIKIHGGLGMLAGVGGVVLAAVYLPWGIDFVQWTAKAAPFGFVAGILVTIAAIALLQALVD